MYLEPNAKALRCNTRERSGPEWPLRTWLGHHPANAPQGWAHTPAVATCLHAHVKVPPGAGAAALKSVIVLLSPLLPLWCQLLVPRALTCRIPRQHLLRNPLGLKHRRLSRGRTLPWTAVADTHRTVPLMSVCGFWWGTRSFLKSALQRCCSCCTPQVGPLFKPEAVRACASSLLAVLKAVLWCFDTLPWVKAFWICGLTP